MNPLWAEYVRVLRQQVVPALGCAEPIALALASAHCRALPGKTPQRIMARVSRNMYKNRMGVGVPGTGMVGLSAAAAIGALAGDADAGLQVLRNVRPHQIPAARALANAVHVVVLAASLPSIVTVRLSAKAGALFLSIASPRTKAWNAALSAAKLGQPTARRAIKRDRTSSKATRVSLTASRAGNWGSLGGMSRPSA